MNSYQGKLSELLKSTQATFIDLVGLEVVSFEENEVTGRLKISNKHHQPFGFMHGGISLVIAETLSSIGSYMIIDNSKYQPFGQDINANHLKSISEGVIVAKCKPIHLGKRVHVWETEIKEEARNSLVAVSRCTIAIVEKR